MRRDFMMGLILHGDGDRIVIADLCSGTEASSRPGGRLDRERFEGHNIDARPAAEPTRQLRDRPAGAAGLDALATSAGGIIGQEGLKTFPVVTPYDPRIAGQL